MQGTILVVDDNPSNLSLLFDLLDKEGFEVLVSQRGETAIHRATYSKPDLILLDVMMPGIDGFDTCRRIKGNQKTDDIPIMFMTALKKVSDKIKGFELGAVDYITKPIQPEEVLARVKAHFTILKLQRDLQQKNKELEESYKREKKLNELKTHFLSMASHDLRTPLASISISLNLLKRYSDRMSREKREKQLEQIHDATELMKEMLDDVLTITKSETGKVKFKPKAVNLTDFSSEIVDEFIKISEETHTINFTHPEKELIVKIDPKLLRHVLSNLLSNAIKYSPAESTVHFDLSLQDNQVIFTVRDEGIGISEKDQANLFEPFQRGTNVGEVTGTGLGLSIVKQMVELHNGQIDVDSTIDEGSTFTVKIPIQK